MPNAPANAVMAAFARTVPKSIDPEAFWKPAMAEFAMPHAMTETAVQASFVKTSLAKSTAEAALVEAPLVDASMAEPAMMPAAELEPAADLDDAVPHAIAGNRVRHAGGRGSRGYRRDGPRQQHDRNCGRNSHIRTLLIR